MKIQDLTNEQADKWCAKADGLIEEPFHVSHALHGKELAWWDGTGMYQSKDEYYPSSNRSEWARLLEEKLYCLEEEHDDSGNYWRAWAVDCHGASLCMTAPTPGRAVVNAVIASVYGDEVPEGEA